MKKENINMANEIVDELNDIDKALSVFDSQGACFETSEFHTEFSTRNKVPSYFNTHFITLMNERKKELEIELEKL